jgi:hypothetical protein
MAPDSEKPPTLMARSVSAAEIRVSWTEVRAAARYVLVASRSATAAADPVYPGSTVVGQFTKPPGRPLVLSVGTDVHEVRLLLVALASNGAELGRSAVVRVRLGS